MAPVFAGLFPAVPRSILLYITPPQRSLSDHSCWQPIHRTCLTNRCLLKMIAGTAVDILIRDIAMLGLAVTQAHRLVTPT